MAEDLEINQLFERYHKKQERRLKIYGKIYNRVIHKIKSVSNRGENVFSTYFVVPEYEFGCPVYNQTTCTAYIIIRLRKIGFDVRYTHPNFLYISWHKFINTHKYKMQPIPDYNKKYNTPKNVEISQPKKFKTFFRNLNQKIITENERQETYDKQAEVLDNLRNRADIISKFNNY